MATGALAQSFDPVQAGSVLRADKLAAARGRTSYPRINPANNTSYFPKTSATTSDDALLAANNNDAFATKKNALPANVQVAEQALSRDQRAAAELHRNRVTQDVRQDSFVDFANDATDGEMEEDIEDIRAQQQALRQASYDEDIASMGPVRRQAQLLAYQARRKAAQAFSKRIEKRAERLLVTYGANFLNFTEQSGDTAWIGYFFTLVNYFIRFAVWVFVPEPNSEDIDSMHGAVKYQAKKTLLRVFPRFSIKTATDFGDVIYATMVGLLVGVVLAIAIGTFVIFVLIIMIIPATLTIGGTLVGAAISGGGAPVTTP